MFIEKVKKEELKKFFHKITKDFSVGEFCESGKKGKYYLQLLTDNYNLQPEFVVTDFSVKGINTYGKMNEYVFGKIIKEFMTNKFGEEYKKAFNENLTNELNNEMIK